MTDRCLGFDPGPTSSSWAILEKPARRFALSHAFHLIAAGTIPSTTTAIRAILEASSPIDTIAAIETPSGYIHEHARGAQLLETRGVATEIRVLAQVLRFKVVTRPAQDIRRAMCGTHRGRGAAGDKAVALAVTRFVSGMPKRSSTHVRDAVLCAAFALFNKGLAQ